MAVITPEGGTEMTKAYRVTHGNGWAAIYVPIRGGYIALEVHFQQVWEVTLHPSKKVPKSEDIVEISSEIVRLMKDKIKTDSLLKERVKNSSI